MLTIILAWFVSNADAEALVRTAPLYLTTETAVEHLSAARLAGAKFKVDPDWLLSMASHESNYDTKARTAEPGGKTSCGVMTPIPKAVCEDRSMLAGYIEGAEHIAGWLYHGARHNEYWSQHISLLGMAGGYALIDACEAPEGQKRSALGPVWKVRKDGHADNICLTPEVFLWRASWIKRERLKSATKSNT